MKVTIRQERSMDMVKFFSIVSYYVGTYTWADGSKYVGNWVENKISGHVKIKK